MNNYNTFQNNFNKYAIIIFDFLNVILVTLFRLGNVVCITCFN